MGEGDSPRGSNQWGQSDNGEKSDREEPDPQSEVSVRRPKFPTLAQFLATPVDRTFSLYGQRSAEEQMDDEEALVGGGDSDDERRSASADRVEQEEEDEEEGVEEEEPEGMVEDEVDAASVLSECTVEYNRQHSPVPEANKVRDHNRPHIVPTCERLGEMKAANTTAAKWPTATAIDPAAIVVLQGRIKEDDEALHYVWYMRVIVDGRGDDSDDKNALLHIPRGTTKDLLTIMAKDEQLCESSLITLYMPTNYNEQRILPKLNSWDMLPKAPSTIAVKPKDAGKGGKTKADERETAGVAEPPAKKAAVKATPPAKPPAKPKVAPPAPKPAASKADGKKPAQTSVTSSMPAKKPANPFEKAKLPAAKDKVSNQPAAVVGDDATPIEEAAPAPTPAVSKPPTVASDTPLQRVPTYDPSAADATAAAASSGGVSRAMNIDNRLTSVTQEFTFNTFERKYIEFTPPPGVERGVAKIVYYYPGAE